MCPKIDSQKCVSEELVKKINSFLSKRSVQILEDELKIDDDIRADVFSPLGTNTANSKNKTSDEQWLADYTQKLRDLSSPSVLQYHKEELKGTTKILSFLLWIFAGTTLSTIVLVAICICKGVTGGAIISSSLGAVIDIIIGWMVKVYNVSLKSKKTYFDAENEREKMDKMLFVLQTISNQDIKDQVTADILRTHFDVDKQK